MGHGRGWHPPRVLSCGRGLVAARRGAGLVGPVPGATPAPTVPVGRNRRVAPLGVAARRRTPAASTPRGTRVYLHNCRRGLARMKHARWGRSRRRAAGMMEQDRKKKNGEGGGDVNDGRPPSSDRPPASTRGRRRASANCLGCISRRHGRRGGSHHLARAERAYLAHKAWLWHGHSALKIAYKTGTDRGN